MKCRYAMSCLAAFALVLLIVVPAQAAIEFTGTVVSIEGHELTVTDGSSDQIVQVTKDTKITIKGKPGKLSDLKTDQEVKVTVEQDGDKLVAKSIVAT